MNKLESIVDMIKTNDFNINDLLRKKEEPKKKKCHTALWIIGGIAAVAAIFGTVYCIYRHCKPDYLEDLDDEFGDDYEDEFDEDDQE